MATLVDDRYELLEVLASGGMATVWRARDTRLGRIVALKRPHPAPAGSKTDERIEREARAAAGVKHPNLVTMFDTGGDEAGPYLVMELVEGPTLASPGREIGPTEAIDIGAQIADALAAVHDAGIVHRDVKPSNVILSERGPCLTDFGIASIAGATEGHNATGHDHGDAELRRPRSARRQDSNPRQRRFLACSCRLRTRLRQAAFPGS